MEDISILNRYDPLIERRIMTSFNRANFPSERSTINPAIDYLISEGGEYFLNYLRFIGLENEPSLLVLSSNHHYYYDFNELKGVSTLINLKKMNLINHLDSFLHTIYRGLSPKTNFIGCFSDQSIKTGVGLPSRMFKGFINFLDSRIDKNLSKNEVTEILETHGFKVINMKEMDGLTYFCAQNIPRQVESA
jgi:hypothetical protein